jgi:hypothetical protein
LLYYKKNTAVPNAVPTPLVAPLKKTKIISVILQEKHSCSDCCANASSGTYKFFFEKLKLILL